MDNRHQLMSRPAMQAHQKRVAHAILCSIITTVPGRTQAPSLEKTWFDSALARLPLLCPMCIF